LNALRQYERVGTTQKQAASNLLTGSSMHSFLTEVQKLDLVKDDKKQSATATHCSGTNPNIPMPTISPVINSSATVNFTINICPTGNISSNNIGSNKQAGEPDESFQDLLKDIDIDDFFS